MGGKSIPSSCSFLYFISLFLQLQMEKPKGKAIFVSAWPGEWEPVAFPRGMAEWPGKGAGGGYCFTERGRSIPLFGGDALDRQKQQLLQKWFAIFWNKFSTSRYLLSSWSLMLKVGYSKSLRLNICSRHSHTISGDPRPWNMLSLPSHPSDPSSNASFPHCSPRSLLLLHTLYYRVHPCL